MRVVRGPTLKDLILSGQLDPGRAVRLLTQVAEALDAAHDVGLIHRDVKPQNILVGAHDHAYLADFGLTKAPGGSGLTEEGQFLGTIDYVSPEQARGGDATHCSDIYALAGVLCECLTGEVPFPRPSEPAVLFAHMSDPPPRLSERRSDLPPALDDVIAKGMAKDSDDRPGSATEFMQDAWRALPPTAAAAVPPPAPAAQPEPGGADDPRRRGSETARSAVVDARGATRARSTPPAEEAAIPAAPRRRWSSVIAAVRKLGRRPRP
jgi:serine/threonine-protein kinase